MKHYTVRPITIQKLQSSEDEGTQHELDRLVTADELACDIIIGGGAFPDSSEHWARLRQESDNLAGTADGHEARQLEWSYYIGMAVGIRLARMKSDAQCGGAR